MEEMDLISCLCRRGAGEARIIHAEPTTVKRANPEWLRKNWEQKKNDTARVGAAVSTASAQTSHHVRKHSQPDQAHYGITISTNTIRRNEGYQIYEESARPTAGQRRSPH
jgi:hypothetical protein